MYNIKYIIAEHPKKGTYFLLIYSFSFKLTSQDGSRTRPYLTILPLATSLSIEPNTSIDRDDASTVASTAKSYVENDDGNVLICWEHGVLGKVVKELGVKHKVEYPGDRFDVIWLVEEPWKELVVVGSEGVEGLDDKWVGVGEGGVGPVLGGGEEEKD